MTTSKLHTPRSAEAPVNTSLSLPELPPGTTPFDAPLAYLAAGLRPIALAGVSEQSACTCPKGAACGKPGKHPRSKDWQRGMTAPELRAAFERDPRGNVGLVMGGEARLAALDIDGALGREQLAAFERQHGPLPQTATARTGSDDSEHRVFRVPPHLDLAALSNRVGVAGRSAAGGLDVRAEGGQIVVEPSLHRSGRRYQWTCRGPIADMPEALFRWLTEPAVEATEEAGKEAGQGGLPFDGPTPDTSPGPAPSSPHPKASSASASGASSASSAPHDPRANRPEAFERARRYLAEMPPAIQGQGGSKRLFRAAVVLVRGFNLSDADALELLWQDFNPRCQPPWNRKDKDGPEHKVRDARRKGDMPFGALLEKEGDWRTPPDEQARARRAAGPGATSSRPEGEHHQEHDHHDQEPETHAPEPAPFLPLQTPRDLPGFPVEALPPVVATFVDQLAEYLECPVDLPACLALGALASASMKRFEVCPRVDWHEPINLYLAVALEPGESKSPAFKSVFAPLYALQKQQSEAWQADCKRIDERNASLGKGEKPEPKPARPRLFIDDATPEKIGAVMAEQNERITLASDEGTAFQMMTGLYSKGGQNNVGLYLKAHDGGRYVVDRMLRESIHLEQPLMTVALAIQPTVIRELSKRPDLRQRGLWARFAYAFPASRVGTQTFRTPPVDPEARDEWRALVMRLAGSPLPEAPEVLSFTPEATDRLFTVAAEIGRACPPGGSLFSVRDWASKLRGFMARVAGLLHVASSEAPARERVSLATIESALQIGRYFTRHALYTFNVEMTLDPAEQAARGLWETIQRKGWTRITTREVCAFVRALRKTPDALAAIESLVRQGCLERDTAHHGQAWRVRAPRGGRPGGGVADNADDADAIADAWKKEDRREKKASSSSSSPDADIADGPSHTRAQPPPGSPPTSPPVSNVSNVSNGVSPEVSEALPSASSVSSVSNASSPSPPEPTPPPPSHVEATPPSNDAVVIPLPRPLRPPARGGA